MTISTPLKRFCQNSSKLLDSGRRPEIPAITISSMSGQIFFDSGGGGKERSGQSVNRKPSLNYMDITKNCVNVSVSFILNQLFVSWGHRVGAKLGIGGRMCVLGGHGLGSWTLLFPVSGSEHSKRQYGWDSCSFNAIKKR